MLRCRGCGEENGDAARFCSACSAPLNVSSAREVRKTITIVFCDLVGSTSLGERFDPESLRRIISTYYEETRSALKRHGGRVQKFIGDAVVGVFGIPITHEDDALRAVRAAADMRTRVAILNEDLERRWATRLQVRIGVNTGEVVASQAGIDGESFVVGDALNIAARLEQAAPPGAILIGQETHRLLGDAIDADEVEPLSLAGKSYPVAAFRLDAVASAAPHLRRRIDSPMVGRDEELTLLEVALDRAIGDSRCELAIVTGPAGIGKSRLATKFISAVGDRAVAVTGRCLSYGDGITFWPLAEILTEALQIPDEASTEQVMAKIASLVPEDDEADVIWERIGGALGLVESASQPQELFWAVARGLEALAIERPLIIVFDDIHWAEATFLDLVDYLATSITATAMLVIGLARPQLTQMRPDWTSRAISLKPLTPLQSRQLIANRLGKTTLPEETTSRIAASAEGNPLFLEEFVSLLADTGFPHHITACWPAAEARPDVTVPSKIRALLASRIDGLGSAEREALDCASVIGQEFWPSAVASLLPEPDRHNLDAHLAHLVEKEFLRRTGTGFKGEAAFSFAHSLIRDVAYAGLLKERCVELHDRFARWLEVNTGERVGQYAEIVGYHIEQACRCMTELSVSDERFPTLAARAAGWLALSGRRALARGDMPAAVNLLERALALMPHDDTGRADVSLRLGIALAETGDVARADAMLSQRIEDARRGRHFLMYRDAAGAQRIFELGSARPRVTVGRKSENDIALRWDSGVSRIHATLELVDGAWDVVDEGISRNGSYLNGERITGRQALTDGDTLRFGDTLVLYRAPRQVAPVTGSRGDSETTALGRDLMPHLSDRERRVLIALSQQLTEATIDVARAEDTIAAALSMRRADVIAAISGLAKKFGIAELQETQRLHQIVERAQGSGILSEAWT